MEDEKSRPTADPSAEPGAAQRGGKYLTFELAGEAYGIEILKVQEIIGLLPITRVPRTPEFMLGVVNLRGRVIPIMDLRLAFEMPAQEPTEETCIIVVQLEGMQTGVVVDRVSEVRDVSESEVDDAPNFGGEVDTNFLLGIAKSEGRVTMLLDIDRILTRGELEQLRISSDEAATIGVSDATEASAKAQVGR